MTIESISVHQVVHGYSNGHSLLATSMRLPKSVERILLLLTDLSGPSAAREFDTYLTGYPLEDISMYALARTWYAHEMKRPGCVWTHTLLIEKPDLGRIADITPVPDLFRRPEGEPGAYYRSPLKIRLPRARPLGSHLARDSLETICLVLAALYGDAGAPVFLPADAAEQYEALALAVWGQQWPRLRYSFCFSTGSIASRRLDGRTFDLQAIPRRSVARIRGEVPLALFIDLSRPGQPCSTPSWAVAAGHDLALASPRGELRDFLWTYGDEQPDGRAAFHKLVEAWADLGALRQGQLPMQGLIEGIAHQFPTACEAPLLKSAIFGGTQRGTRRLLPETDEETLVRELVTTKYYTAFDSECLRIRDRARDYWQASASKATQLVVELLQCDLNPLGEEYVIGLSRAVRPSDAVQISRTNRTLLYTLVRHNPGLAGVPEVWDGSRDEQCELLDHVSSSPELDTPTVRSVVDGILESKSDSIAAEVVSTFGDAAVASILDWADSSSAPSPQLVQEAWKRALTSRPSDVLAWVQRSTHTAGFGMAFAATVLDPNSTEVTAAGAKLWLPLARRAPGRLEGAVLTQMMSFLLALGLNNPGQGSHELVEHSFEVVHDAARKGSLDYSDWRFLGHHVPKLPWWRDWDKSERLRQALVAKFIDYRWPIASFLRSVRTPHTFEQIVEYCGRTREPRAFVRRMAEEVASGHLEASQAQKQILARYG